MKVADILKSVRSKSFEEGDKYIKSITEPEAEIYVKDGIHSAFHNGKQLRGGSSFKENFTVPFDKKNAYGLAKYWGVSGDAILKIWDDKAESTSSFGTAIHRIRELVDLGLPYEYDEVISAIRFTEKKFEENKGAGEIIQENKKECEENYALPTHSDIREMMYKTDDEIKVLVDKIEEEFITLEKSLGYNEMECIPEAYVTYLKLLMGGEIDKLLIIDKESKICRVQDYKVQGSLEVVERKNALLNELAKKKASKLDIVKIQLSYYAYKLIKAGWTVYGGDVYGRDGSWNHYELELIPFEKMDELVNKYLK